MMKRKYLWALTACFTLSLFIHVGLLLGLQGLPTPPPLRNTVAIEVELREPKNNAQVFVTDPEIGQKLDRLQETVQRFSRYTRKVQKEQVARFTGRSQNHPQSTPVRLQKKTSSTTKNKGLSFKRDLLTSNSRKIAPTYSTISEHIPNVKKGGFTALNTNKIEYYAFNKRTNEQVRVRWTQNLHQASSRLSAPSSQQLLRRNYVTDLELVLNKKGEFVTAFIDKSSRSKLFDEAALNALIDASPFINPPLSLIDDDEFIRLNYRFHVEWNPRYVAKDQSPGN